MNALLATMLAGLTCVGSLLAQPPRDSVRMRSYRACSIELRHLRLLDGRRLYRGSRSLRETYPYLVAANDEDRAAGVAWTVTLRRAHRIFERPVTDAAAHELLDLMFPAAPIATAEQYRAIADVARRYIASEPSWTARVEPGEPKHHGVRVTRAEDGPVVEGLLLMCGGAGALDVEQVTIGFPASGAFRVTRTVWIHGPPQSWQTSGSEDAERQRAMWDEVQDLRRAMMAPLRANRDPERFARVLRRGPTYAHAVFMLGEPDEMIGSGRLIYRYAFADTTAAIVVSAGEDLPVLAAHRVRPRPGNPPEVVERWVEESR